MVDAVHQQHPLLAAGGQRVHDLPQPRDRGIEILGEVRGAEVRLAQVACRHRRSVGRDPPIGGREPVDFVAVAAPVDEAVEAEAGEELRQLGRMAERVRRIRDA